MRRIVKPKGYCHRTVMSKEEMIKKHGKRIVMSPTEYETNKERLEGMNVIDVEYLAGMYHITLNKRPNTTKGIQKTPTQKASKVLTVVNIDGKLTVV